MRCKDCSPVHGYPYKRSHLVALRPTKILALDPPSTWWPGGALCFSTEYVLAPPPSGWMKPYPLVGLNDITVPLGMLPFANNWEGQSDRGVSGKIERAVQEPTLRTYVSVERDGERQMSDTVPGVPISHPEEMLGGVRRAHREEHQP
jgi:hypothetical protein